MGKCRRCLNEQSRNKWYRTVRGRTWKDAQETDRRCIGKVYLLTPWSDWHLINFSLQYYPWIKDDSHENRGNDHQLRKLLIFQQILLLSIIGNVSRTIRRICVLILRGKKLANRSLESSPPREQTTGRERALIPEGRWYNFSVIWKRR